MAALSSSNLSLLIWLITLMALISIAQSQSNTSNLSGDDVLPTGSAVTYSSVNSTMTLQHSTVSVITDTLPFTYLSRGTSSTANQTLSKTSTSKPTNTQPCNNYPEFCTRKYSNITMVTAHNFAFVRKGNVASNQALGVIDQLNDGIRMRKY